MSGFLWSLQEGWCPAAWPKRTRLRGPCESGCVACADQAAWPVRIRLGGHLGWKDPCHHRGFCGTLGSPSQHRTGACAGQGLKRVLPQGVNEWYGGRWHLWNTQLEVTGLGASPRCPLGGGVSQNPQFRSSPCPHGAGAGLLRVPPAPAAGFPCWPHPRVQDGTWAPPGGRTGKPQP